MENVCELRGGPANGTTIAIPNDFPPEFRFPVEPSYLAFDVGNTDDIDPYIETRTARYILVECHRRIDDISRAVYQYFEDVYNIQPRIKEESWMF